MATITPTQLLFVAGLSGVASVVLFARAGVSLYAAMTRLGRDPPLIRDAIRSDEPDEFTGRIGAVTRQAAFDAPFSGRPAVLASVEVDEWRRRPGRAFTRGWVTTASGAVGRPFIVEDETDRIKVQATDLTVETGDEQPEVVIDSGEFLPVDVRLRLSGITDAIDDLGSILAQGERGRRRRYREAAITTGDRVHVTGAGPSGRPPRRADVDAVFTPTDDETRVSVLAGEKLDESRGLVRTGLASLVAGVLAAVPLVVVAVLQFAA